MTTIATLTATPTASKNNIYNIAKKISANDEKLIGLFKNIKKNIENIKKNNKENEGNPFFVKVEVSDESMYFPYVKLILDKITSPDLNHHLKLKFDKVKNITEMSKFCTYVDSHITVKTEVEFVEPEWIKHIGDPYQKELMKFLMKKCPDLNQLLNQEGIKKYNAGGGGGGGAWGGAASKNSFWSKILELDGKTYLVHGKTQSGKTMYIQGIVLMNLSIHETTSVIVLQNCIGDSRQLKQRFNSLIKEITKYFKSVGVKDHDLPYIYVGDVKTKADKMKLENAMMSKTPSTVVLLANKAQLNVLKNAIYSIIDDGKKPKYIPIIDEVDSTAYGDGVVVAEFREILHSSVVEHALKVYGITATGFDAVFTEEKIETSTIIRINPSPIYKGIDYLKMICFNDDLPVLAPSADIDSVFEKHPNLYNILKETNNKTVYGDVYTPDLKPFHPVINIIKFNHLKSEQLSLLKGISKTVGMENWSSIINNGDGVYIYHPEIELLDDGDEVVFKDEKLPNVRLFKHTTISRGLQYFIKLNKILIEKNKRTVSHVTIIGGTLVERGLSYVSDDYSWHPTMFCYCSESETVAAKMQAVGRGTGNFGDKIPITLYASKKTIEDIIKGYKLQEEIYDRAQAAGPNKSMPALVKTIPFHKDKIPKTKLATQKIAKISAVIKKGDDGGLDVGFYTNVIKGINKIQLETPIGGDDTEEDVAVPGPVVEEDDEREHYKALLLESGVKIAKLDRWFDDDCNLVVATMIKCLYKQDGEISVAELKELIVEEIEYDGTDEQFQNNIASGCGVRCLNGKMWSSLDDMIELNPVVREYLETL